MGNESLDCQLDRTIDNYYGRQTLPGVLGQQRDVHHYNSVALEVLVNTPVDFAPDCGMHDRVKEGERLGAREGNVGERSPVERTVWMKDAITKFRHEFGNEWLSGSLKLTHDGVGIDNHGSQLTQPKCGRRFSGANAAGQPHEDHDVTGYRTEKTAERVTAE